MCSSEKEASEKFMPAGIELIFKFSPLRSSPKKKFSIELTGALHVTKLRSFT
jgi:hypothetical protein